jgi:quercetin dioxygenase-like cupin family protein
MEYPKARYEKPILIRPQHFNWVPDRQLAGVEHKHLGAFGERRSGMRLTRLAGGARIPAHVQDDAEILYLTAGSISYDGKIWNGGKTKDEGTYIYVPPGGDVQEIATPSGAEFFVIMLPMLADIEADIKAGRRAARRS